MKRHGEVLLIEPCLPPEWTRVDVSYRFGATVYDIALTADCETPRRVAHILVDGAAVPGAQFSLVDDGATHTVRVQMEIQTGRVS